MITVSSSHALSANYFTREGYFEHDAGVWFGGGLARGLEGQPVRKLDFECLRFGLAPDGTPLLQNAGKRTRDGRGTPHPLVQITFNAPKDLAFLLSLFPERREALLKAHRDAVLAVARYIEKHLAFVRSGKGGKHFVRALICAALFEHLAARDGSPHLHTHLVIFPAALAADGKTRRIAERVLFRAQKALSALFDAELAKNLRALGLNTIPLEVGFRIQGVPDKARHILAPRRAEILAELKSRGLSGAKHAERVTKLTRRHHPKEDRSPEQVFDRARALLAGAGFTRERCHDSIFPSPAPAHNRRPSDEAIIERAITRLPSDRPFVSSEVECAIAKEASRFGLGLAVVVDLAKRWLSSASAVLVSDHVTRRAYVHQKAYREIDASLARLLDAETSPVSSRTIRRLSSAPALPESARDAVSAMLGSGPRVRLLLTEPGVEKERLLASIGSLPVPTLGLALTIKQREHMEELGLDRSFTVARAIKEWGLADWNWRPFRDAPHRHPIERIETSPWQDELAAGFGFISRTEQRDRAWQRSREGLDLSGNEERIIVLDDAAWVDPARLARVLREVERGARSTLLLVADPRERFFTPLPESLQPIELKTAQKREDELRLARLVELQRTL